MDTLLAQGAAADARDGGGRTAEDLSRQMGAPDTPGLLRGASPPLVTGIERA